MAIITKLQEHGNSIAVIFSDGSRVLATPASTDLYRVAPNPNHVETLRLIGDNFILCYNDGTFIFAYATGNSLWIVGPNSDPVPPWAWPYQYSVGVIAGDEAAQFGERINPVTGESQFHFGLDFGAAAVQGHQNRAASAGLVIAAGPSGTAGEAVRITHAGGFETRYYHHVVGSLLVAAGDTVSLLQELGTMGMSGSATGVHLHWETLDGGVRIDPRIFMADRGVPES